VCVDIGCIAHFVESRLFHSPSLSLSLSNFLILTAVIEVTAGR
jgi:hypothetical protein